MNIHPNYNKLPTRIATAINQINIYTPIFYKDKDYNLS